MILGNRIEFNCVNNDKISIMPIYNPFYIYEVGQKFTWRDIPSDGESSDMITIGEFEVTNVTHEIQFEYPLLSSIQIIIVDIKLL